MYTASDYAQLIVHYTNGETEVFNIYAANTDGSILEYVKQNLPTLLEKRWFFLQLAEESVCINTDLVTYIEVKPGLFSVETEGVLGSGERVTALTRSR